MNIAASNDYDFEKTKLAISNAKFGGDFTKMTLEQFRKMAELLKKYKDSGRQDGADDFQLNHGAEELVYFSLREFYNAVR